MTIPTNLRAPIMAVEFDSSRAFQGPAVLAYKALLIGGRLTSGTVAEKVLKPITSADQAGNYFGFGSELHRMARKWFKNNKFTETIACALADDATGVPATGSIAFSGTATAAGVVYAYIGGQRVTAAVTSGDAATAVGDALKAAADLVTSLATTQLATTGTVAFTAKNDGEEGNSITLRLNYNAGEELPAGITAVITPMASGANNPDIQDVLDILGDEWYQVIVSPYTDATNLTAIEAELADRFDAIRMIDGVYFCAKRDTQGNLTTFGNGRNSPHVSCFEATDVIDTVGEYAAAIAGQIAAEGSIDPARPFQSLELKDISPVPVAERFDFTERNILLSDGISTVRVDHAGVVRIERAITMYQKNPSGADDIAYLNVNTLLTLLYIRYDWRNHINTNYPRAKLADDGVRVGPGQQVMTPKTGKAEALVKFRQWEVMGLVENFDQFKNDLQCYRSLSDPDRLEWVLPPDLMNQFRVGGSVIQFLLQAVTL